MRESEQQSGLSAHADEQGDHAATATSASAPPPPPPAPGIALLDRADGATLELENVVCRCWPGISARFAELAAPVAYDFKSAGPANCITLLDLYRLDGETAIAALGRRHTRDLRNRLTFMPRGCGLHGWSQLARRGSFTEVLLEPSAACEQGIALDRLPPLYAVEDQALRMVMLRFRALLRNPALDMPGYAETLAEVIAFDLNRIVSQRTRTARHHGGLTSRQLRTVIRHMDDRATETVTVAELAALLGLTRFHFIRAFKQATGLPPHQFMMRRRIALAQELLGDPRASIAEVAKKTGFGSAIQLTRTFRRFVGITPSKFRRELL